MTARIGLRLDALPREALLELCAAGCAASTKLRSHADALIQQHNPLPGWCTDVMLSADLLPHVIDSLELSRYAAATVCSAWAVAWARLLRLRHCVNPRPLKPLELSTFYTGYAPAVMPDGDLCCCDFESQRLRFVSPESGEERVGGPWSSLAQKRLEAVGGILLHGNALLVSCREHVLKLRLSDAAELARSPELSTPGEMTLFGDRLAVASNMKIHILDANTLQLTHMLEGVDNALDVAVHSSTLYVADSSRVGEVLAVDLANDEPKDHDPIRGEFGRPAALSIHQGRIYIIEEPPEPFDEEPDGWQKWAARRLVVLEMDGSTRQIVRLPDSEALSALHINGDVLYLTEGEGETKRVHKLQLF